MAALWVSLETIFMAQDLRPAKGKAPGYIFSFSFDRSLALSFRKVNSA